MEENVSVDSIEALIDNLKQDRMLSGDSTKWANWMSVLLPNSCRYCVDQHGKIVDASILGDKTEVQAHPNCQCVYVPMRAKAAGSATDMGMDGADVYMMNHGHLPDYYVDKDTAQLAGWRVTKKKLSAVLPGKMIGGDVYENNNLKLPSAPGRIWHEADINYTGGKRNRQRLLYSSDGLLFVTYDHYQTFYEITKEGVSHE